MSYFKVAYWCMYVRQKAHFKIIVENPLNSLLIAKTWHMDTQKPSINFFCFSMPLSFGLPVSETMWAKLIFTRREILRRFELNNFSVSLEHMVKFDMLNAKKTQTCCTRFLCNRFISKSHSKLWLYDETVYLLWLPLCFVSLTLPYRKYEAQEIRAEGMNEYHPLSQVLVSSLTDIFWLISIVVFCLNSFSPYWVKI